MKKIIKKILYTISRIFYFITPDEFKKKICLTDIELRIQENLADETFKNFSENFKQSLLFNKDHWMIKEYSIKTAIENNKSDNYFYLEFGVFKGQSANYFSKFVNKIYAFDSFEGLDEDWPGTDMKKNYFNLNKKAPKLNKNIEIIIGKVEDTIESFLQEYNPQINFVHFDMDTYMPTKFVLEKIKPYLVKNSILLFDEFYNYVGWEYGEYKAVNEVFQKNEFVYKAFNLKGAQCAIQVT